MLKRITLTCFKQHTDRTIDFSAGINAIRAPNGSGKSNILLAIAYALFGHKALPETLEDTVTYGQPLNKLKVVLEFGYAGVDYVMSRGKSGAELTFGSERITGQTETIKAVERLLGVSADMASKLMLAKQKSVGGALAGGPSVAGKTIEDLAGLGLIDEIVEMIQTQLPVGVTTGVESRIALLTEQAKEVESIDVAPLEAAVTAAGATLVEDRRILADKLADLESLDVVQANQILADHARLTTAVAARGSKIEALVATLAEPLPEAPADGAIDAMRAKVEAQKSLDAAARIHAGLQDASLDVLWDEPRASLDEAIAAAQGRIASLNHVITERQAGATVRRKAVATAEQAINVALAQAQARAIKETTCAFCQKDLTDVPEVATFNAALAQEIEGLTKQLADHLEAAAGDEASDNEAMTEYVGQRADATTEVNELAAVAKQDDAFERILASAGDHITIDRSVVPARWTWTGPTDAPQDFAGELATLVAQERTAIAAAATRAGQKVALEDLNKTQADDQAALAALLLVDAQETIDLANEIRPKIAALRAAVEAAADAVHLAEGALATAKMSNEQGAKTSKQAKEQLALAQKELDEMGANNALVRKLRQCRPQITDRLWNLVLAAVTLYFSQIRGQHSVITRSDSIFKVNGFPVSGLSGAEEDILGLAVRLSLVKTFLPLVDFMILDEVASACDDQRESAMLGLLSTVGFGQVILVSHADIVDSFADTVIQL